MVGGVGNGAAEEVWCGDLNLGACQPYLGEDHVALAEKGEEDHKA